MSKILYEVYKNDIKDSESVMYGKYYARLKSIETMSMARMAKHISEHGSVYTEDVVEGVMKKFKTCLLEMLLESKKVKVAGAPEGAAHPLPARPGCRGQHLEPRVHQEG